MSTFRVAAASIALVVLTGCGIGYPWPTVGTTQGHRDVIVFGDSLSGNTLALLPSLLAARGLDATVIDAHVNASGLLSPMMGVDPLDFVNSKLDAHPEADIAIFQWIGHCPKPCVFPYGSAAFLAAWQATMQAIIDATRARGIKVVWAVSPPPVPPDRAQSPSPDYQQFYKQSFELVFAEARLASQPGVFVTSWYTALAARDDFIGGYDTVLLYDGAWHNVRTDDLVHLTVDGAIRTSVWTAATLAAIW